MRVSSMPIVGKIPRPASDRPDQNFWPAAPTSGLATRVLLEDTSAISAAFHFHRANAFRSSTCSLEFHDRREERESVACSTNFTNFRDGGGGLRVALPPLPAGQRFGHVEIANWNETRENWGGNWGWCESRFESQILERWGGYFFQMFKVRSRFQSFWEREQFVRCLIRYRCIEHFFERFPVTEGSNDACKASLNLVGLGGL